MKQYTLIVKFQVENPENSKAFKNILKDIEEQKANGILTFDDITTTEVKLEEVLTDKIE